MRWVDTGANPVRTVYINLITLVGFHCPDDPVEAKPPGKDSALDVVRHIVALAGHVYIQTLHVTVLRRFTSYSTLTSRSSVSVVFRPFMHQDRR